MITQSRLKELVHYDPNMGVFTNLVQRSSTALVGQTSGNFHNKRGYHEVRLDGVRYSGHRLAWLYMTGVMSDLCIDHVDRDPSNNRWDNLREVTHKQNLQNQKRKVSNKSGVTGVMWNKVSKKWQSFICVNGKQLYLGLFHSKDAAILKRKAAELRYGFFGDHGASNPFRVGDSDVNI